LRLGRTRPDSCAVQLVTARAPRRLPHATAVFDNLLSCLSKPNGTSSACVTGGGGR